MTKPHMPEKTAVRHHDEGYALLYWLDVEEKDRAKIPELDELERQLEQAARTGKLESMLELAKLPQKAAEWLLTSKNIPAEHTLSRYGDCMDPHQQGFMEWDETGRKISGNITQAAYYILELMTGIERAKKPSKIFKGRLSESSYTKLVQAEAKQQWRELKDYSRRMGSKSESIRYAITPLPADAEKIVESRLYALSKQKRL